MKTKKKFKQLWIVSVAVEAFPGYEFNDLIDCSDCNETLPVYIGAWANVIIQSLTIHEGLSILECGLKEKKLKVKFIDKIENMYSLIENNELNVDVIKEAEWLYHLHSDL